MPFFFVDADNLIIAMKYLLSIVFALFFMGGLQAQQAESVPFNGLIEDASGKPMAKVKIELKGVGVYTYSDKEGRFGFTNVQADDVLVFIKKINIINCYNLFNSAGIYRQRSIAFVLQ